MTPRDLGLRQDSRKIQEAVILYDRNRRFQSENWKLGGNIIHLMQKRRHESEDAMCVALLARLPKYLAPIIAKHLGQETSDLIGQARALHDDEYKDFAEAPDTLKVYCLAHAAETLETMAQSNMPKIEHFRRLESELRKAPTSDTGLENIFYRRLDERRNATLVQLGMKSFEYQQLPRDPAVKKAFRLVEEMASDGRVQPVNLKYAMTTAKFLSAMQKKGDDRTGVALCLVDFALMHGRNYADTRRITEVMGKDFGTLVERNSPSRLWSEKQFRDAEPATRLAATTFFIIQSTAMMSEIEKLEKDGKTQSNPAMQRAMRSLDRAETQARKIILPALDMVESTDLQDIFMLKMEMTASFTLARTETKRSPPLLPPHKPGGGDGGPGSGGPKPG